MRDAEGDPWIDIQKKYDVGQSVQGTIENKMNFGYFVELEPGITGLLPKSKINSHQKPASIEKLKLGETIAVVVEEIHPEERKITLGPGDTLEESDWKAFTKDKDTEKPMGSLGEKLQRAMNSKNG